MTSEQFEQTIRELIHHNTSADLFDEWVAQQARSLSALPVGYDLFSCWFLRPAGEVIIVDVIDDEEKLLVVNKRETVIAALTLGSPHYPELLSLLPIRDPEDADCELCNGSGRILSRIICHLCGGTGWLPSNPK